MPLDPSIITGIKAPEIPDPQDFQNKSLTLQNLMQQREAGQLALEKTRQATRDDAAARQAFQGGGTESEIFNRLLAANPTAAMAYKKQMEESRGREAQTAQHTATAGKQKWEVEKEKAERGASLIGMANAQNWEQIIRHGQTAGYWGEEGANHMRQQGYSPELVQQIQRAGQTYAQQQEEQGRAATRAQTAANDPFRAGPGGEPVPQPTVQQFQLDRAAGQELKPHYDAERGIIVDPRTGQGTPITVGGQPVGAKPNAATQKELMTIGQQEATVDGALAAVKKTPGAFGFSRGSATMSGPVAESVRGRFDSKEESEARSYVFNIVSKVINERAGSAQSAQELARLRSFLPGELDNADQITNKLNGFKTYLADLKKGTTPTPPAAAPAPGMRVTPQEQAGRDNEAAGILAQTKTPQWLTENIANNTAALTDPQNKNMKPEHRALITRELAAYKRALEIQRGGGPTVAAPGASGVSSGGATGGWSIRPVP